jgi:hypothetical protein
MKKLIILLTLTMMFGQTKLETRLYEFSGLIDTDLRDFNLSTLTSNTLTDDDFAIIEVLGISQDSNINGAPFLDIIKDNGYYAHSSQFCSFTELLIIDFQHTISLGKDFNYSIKSRLGEFNGTLKLAITAEFPQEDTGYIEDGFDYCVEPGANLMSYPCDSDVALLDAIPSDALSQFSGIIGQGVAATNLNGTWVGSLTAMQSSSGYWIQSNTALCFNYDCSEN